MVSRSERKINSGESRRLYEAVTSCNLINSLSSWLLLIESFGAVTILLIVELLSLGDMSLPPFLVDLSSIIIEDV